MSECRTFICNHCHKSIQAWSDGNPYFIDDQGLKQYAYHPDHKNLEKCIGNDQPHVCLDCGYEFNQDSLSQDCNCPGCQSSRVIATFHMDGQICPSCKEGVLQIDPNMFNIYFKYSIKSNT